LRIGEEKRRKKIETTAAKYNGLPITMGGHKEHTQAQQNNWCSNKTVKCVCKCVQIGHIIIENFKDRKTV